MYENIKKLAQELKPDIIQFVQELVNVPSPTGHEKDIVALIKTYLDKLEYNEVFVDEIGNIVGIMKSSDESSSIIYNSHLDHCPIKSEEEWEHGAFNAKIVDDVIYGCGISDSKAAIASQIYAGYILKKIGGLKGDYIFTGVVKEGSVGCFGIRYLCDATLKNILEKVSLMVLGNPTNLDIFLGHRGKVEFDFTVYGHTCRSSVPNLGVNAIYRMLPVINQVKALSSTLPSHPLLEKATIAVTSISSHPQGSSIPDRCSISIDRHFLPTEPLKEVIGQLQAVIDKITATDPSFKAMIKIKQTHENSYTSYNQKVPRLLLPFLMDSKSDLVQNIETGLKNAGQNPDFGIWTFPTDGSYTNGVMGIPTIGYAPGEERFMGTPFDCVNIESLVKATVGYASIHTYLTNCGWGELNSHELPH